MNYFLVLERRPGDFMPINVGIISKDSYNDYSSLQSIDNFTKMYLPEDIKSMIKENNLVTEDYLEGTLCVINENKYRYKLLSKEINMSLDTFFINNINDKQVMNKFINIYLKYTKDNIEIMKEAIKNKQVDIILQGLFMLPYDKVRNIYFYLYENC